MEVFKARVKIFMACWAQYCLSLIEEDNKKKKKKYTEEINKIKEQCLEKAKLTSQVPSSQICKNLCAKQAQGCVEGCKIHERRCGKDLTELILELQEERKNTPKTLQRPTLKPDESAKKTTTFITATESGVKEKSDPGNTANAANTGKPKKIRFYPSKEEMKEAYDKLLEEALRNLESPR